MYYGPLQRIRAYYRSIYFNISYLRVVQKHIKELVRQTAMHVLNAGGVVRGIDSWGTCRLPQRMRRHQQYYDKGEWVEASPPRSLSCANGLLTVIGQCTLTLHRERCVPSTRSCAAIPGLSVGRCLNWVKRWKMSFSRRKRPEI